MRDSKVFIIYGPPGSGKGTQARRLAKYFDLKHFDTGHFIEELVHSPNKQNDPIIRKEKHNFETGLLCDPEWVAEIVVEEIKQLHKKGKGIIFSGSPRTLKEARIEIPLLERLYGKRNIYVIEIIVKPETSVFRNSHRRVCKQCGYPLIYTPENEKLEKCPKCGGELITRILDEPEVIKIRIKEYQERTRPIYKFLEERNIKIHRVDGEPLPEIVTENILKAIKSK